MKNYIGLIALVPVCLHAQEMPVEPPPPTPKPVTAPVQTQVSVVTAVPNPLITPAPAVSNAALQTVPPLPIPNAPPPEAPHELYTLGNFPQTGVFCHPQQLAAWANSRPSNLWLVGLLRVVGYEDDHHLILQTGAAPHSIGQPQMDLLGGLVHRAIAEHLVTVHVFIEQPKNAFEAGTVVQYNRSYPLKVVQIQSDGNRIEVEARDLLRK